MRWNALSRLSSPTAETLSLVSPLVDSFHFQFVVHFWFHRYVRAVRPSAFNGLLIIWHSPFLRIYRFQTFTVILYPITFHTAYYHLGGRCNYDSTSIRIRLDDCCKTNMSKFRCRSSNGRSAVALQSHGGRLEAES